MSDCNIYLGFTPSDKLMSSLYELDSRPAVQTVNFGRKLLSVIEAQGDVINISSAPIQDFPYCRKFFVLSDKNRDENELFIPFINFILIKQFFRFLGSLFFLFFGIKEKKRKVIFLHGVHLPFILSSVLSKFLGYKLVLYATDPPGVILSSDGILRIVLKKIDKYILNYLFRYIDGVIVPSKDFIDTYDFKDKVPFEVVPGIMDEVTNNTCECADLSTRQCISVCYSGSIYKNNGIENLITSSEFLPTNVHIHILGGGEDFDSINELASKYDNVFVHGFKSGDAYQETIENMDILVNVRPPAQDFTRYSFPSKLFEYLKLNKPVITTRIPSIPDEIEDCFNYFSSANPKDIADGICEVIRKNEHKSIKDKFNCAYAHYSIDGVSRKIKRLMRKI
ncbi:glycosyltransferase [Vibrio vulnificus]|nr:glycosyltransferase [Vibrio vulnificus]